MSTYIETLTRGNDYIAPRTKLEAVDGAENLYTKTEVNTLLASKVDGNNTITGATKCKITYDSKGLITSGADLSTSDIPNLDTSKITSGTFADSRIASAATWNAKANVPVIVSISLLATSWSGSSSPYSQTISVTGSTANSKIDLQPDATVLGQMIDDGCMAICVVNNDNVLTAYAVGDKPTANLTVQATMYEVIA